MINITDQHKTTPSKDTTWGITWRTGWEEVESVERKMGTMNKFKGREKIKEDINYSQQHLSLIKTLPKSSNKPP